MDSIPAGVEMIEAVAAAMRDVESRAARVLAAEERHALLHLIGVLDVLREQAQARGDAEALADHTGQVREAEMRLGVGE